MYPTLYPNRGEQVVARGVRDLPAQLGLDLLRGHSRPFLRSICGPLSSAVTAEALESDPLLIFDREPDTGLWTIRDRATGDRFVSLLDLSAGATDPDEIEWADFSYAGRLDYRGRRLLVIAGQHALGSVGAVDYLTRHLPELYAGVGTERFSMVVRSEHDGETVTRSELACPPRMHQ